MMDSLFNQWNSVLIGIGSLVSLWLWSDARDWCLQIWTFWRHAAQMDGPPALPIIGNAHYFTGSPEETLKKCISVSELYTSPFRFWLGPKLGVVVTNPVDIQVVVSSSKATYKANEYKFFEAFLGRGLVTTSGPTHKTHRNLIMPMVNGKAVDAYIESFDTHSRRCVKCLESMVGQGEFDILPFISLCTMDITLDSIIGAPATAQQNGDTELVNCMQKLFYLSHERITKPWLYPDWIYYRTRRGKQYIKAKTILQQFMNDMVAEKKKEYYNSTNDDLNLGLTKTALLDQMIAYNEKNKLMDDARLADEVFTVLAAAQDPSALISSFTLLMLGMHPEIQDKVRKEVREVVGDENLTVRTLSQLKYLDMVIKETIRLFPVGPILGRKVQEDLHFESWTAPKDCIVILLMFTVHRDPKIWVEPENFNPDRFLPENSVGRHPYAYLPFSSGARGCIGQQYAKMVIKTLVARVVQKYKLHSNVSLKNLLLTADISVRSLEGYKVSKENIRVIDLQNLDLPPIIRMIVIRRSASYEADEFVTSSCFTVIHVHLKNVNTVFQVEVIQAIG